MRTGSLASLTLLSVALLAGAADPDLERGAALIRPFKQQLQGALQQAMAQGPVEAVSACRIEAPRIAALLSQDGVRVGRSSHRLRNPANVAPPWVEPLLREYLEQPQRREPRVVRLDEARRGYVEPIVTQPLCLACHGQALPEDVSTRLRELYPDDRAVGFRAGDLRGVFWAEFPVTD